MQSPVFSTQKPRLVNTMLFSITFLKHMDILTPCCQLISVGIIQNICFVYDLNVLHLIKYCMGIELLARGSHWILNI